MVCYGGVRHVRHSTVGGVRTSVKISLTVVGLVVVLAAAVTGGLMLWRPAFLFGPECTVPGDPAASGVTGSAVAPTVELTAVQLQHASTINAVGLSRGIPERGRIIAIATAYQESTLRNLPDGDRDSVGLFQQRPSQGWGTPGQIGDPIYASDKFYDALMQVPQWQTLPLTEAAQAVQYSAFPDAYARWEPRATTLVRALSGNAALQLSCRADAPAPTTGQPERPPPTGADAATPALAAVLSSANAEFGGLTVQSVSGDGRTGVASIGSAQMSPSANGRSLAAWSVAHGAGLTISEVVTAEKRWVDNEWQDAPSPLDNGTDPARVQITVGG